MLRSLASIRRLHAGFLPLCALILVAAMAAPPAHAVLGTDWYEAVTTAPWSARASHEMTSHNGSLYLISGSYLQDVWKSEDGIHWTEVLDVAPWVGRRDPGFISFQGKLWLLGGWLGGMNALGDAWSSPDGETWTLVNETAFSPRPRVFPLLFDDKLWVAGGEEDGVNNDVWMSEDGETWTQVLAQAPWLPRWGQEMLVHDGKMWMLGGAIHPDEKYADVWSSEDGVTWTQLPDAPWARRAGHAAVTFDNRMWIIGGDDEALVRLNDVWSSEDGIAWTEHTPAASWSARRVLATAVHNGRIWMSGGQIQGGANTNDVWFTEPVEEGEIPTFHSADQDVNRRVGLSELLRVVQFYNLHGYGCEPGEDDGYMPGDPDRDCAPHDSDYAPQDWRIALGELMRLIQFYNLGGYHVCDAGEDGYCPGIL
jgi:hypothetical protein